MILFYVTNLSNIKLFYSLGYSIATYQSYTFCPLYILELINLMDDSDLLVSALLLKIMNKIKENSDDKEEIINTIKVFEPIMDWLFNVLHAKIDPFPFHCKILSETTSWYNGIYLEFFGIDEKRLSSKCKVTSITDSDNNSKDTVLLDNLSKKVKFISVLQ